MLSPHRTFRYALLVVLFAALLYFRSSWPTYDRLRYDHRKHRILVSGDIGMDYLVKSSFDWSSLPRRWPVSKVKDLPKGKPHLQPRIQADGRDSGAHMMKDLHRGEKKLKRHF